MYCLSIGLVCGCDLQGQEAVIVPRELLQKRAAVSPQQPTLAAAGGWRITPEIRPGHGECPRQGFGDPCLRRITAHNPRSPNDCSGLWHAEPVCTLFLGDSNETSGGLGSNSRMSWVLELCHETHPWDLEFLLTLISSKPSWKIRCVYVCACMHDV